MRTGEIPIDCVQFRAVSCMRAEQEERRCQLNTLEKEKWGREGVRLVKPPRVTSGRYLSTWKDVSTLPAHPKEGEHAANWEAAFGIKGWQWPKSVTLVFSREGSDSRCRAPSQESQAPRDCLLYNGAEGPPTWRWQ